MNKQFERDLKALNIRDVKNDASFRRNVGVFKKVANELGVTQSELLKMVIKESYENSGLIYKQLHKPKIEDCQIMNVRELKKGVNNE